MCPTCEALVPGRVVGRENGVFVTRDCPTHGAFEGLVCSDLAWYEALPRFDVEPVKPQNPHHPAAKGCPEDCGLCTAHRQIAGTAAIEISNTCNAQCPVCLAENRDTFELSVSEVNAAVDALLKAQDHVDALALSGGEPTVHPKLFEILKAVDRPQVSRIALNSNGIRIASDDAFVAELAKHPKVYVSLHHDGKRAKELRGTEAQVQVRALDRLLAAGINVAPLVLAAKGVNDVELGAIVKSLLVRRGVRSAVLSMMTYTGTRGSKFPGDPLTRLTIPEALDCIEAGSGGTLHRRDFMPLPMPNPLCAAVGYFLVDGDELTPLIPLADLDQIIACTKNSNFAGVNPELERLLRDTIDRLYAHPDRYTDAPKLLAKFRKLLTELFPDDGQVSADRQRTLVEERIKMVYLMQFMDCWSFDSKRLSKCSCQHLLPGGRSIPSCAYYSYHRHFDGRFAPRSA
jgi:uncharacterized radical SAM superfamily Fe-S cluster-containing enzyme